jgi:N-acetylmuramoyl-L-alanine amidase
MVVILGTAHSKSTPGKCSPDKKLREYQYSREICQEVKKQLILKGINCVIDILEDEEKSLQNRCNIVNNYCKQFGAENCIYISIHVNAAGMGDKWMSAKGWSVFVCPTASQNSKTLAQTLCTTALFKNLKGNRSVPINKYWTSNLYVLKNTKCPAVLTENMFQDNKEDVEFLLSEKGKQTITEVHVEGILTYLKTLGK